MKADLFPPQAAFCYVVTDPHDHDLSNYRALPVLEQTLVSRSVDLRKSEFGDARWCAHQALSQLGADARAPILRGERGMPLWPEGFTGSMTHTEGLRAAVVAPTSAVRSLGIDAEPALALPGGVLGAIARTGELPQLDQLRAGGVDCPDRLLFSAKEAAYKAWFPLTRRWLGFEQAEVDLRADGTFVAYLLVRPTPVPFISGRWQITDGFIITATAVTEVASQRYLRV